LPGGPATETEGAATETEGAATETEGAATETEGPATETEGAATETEGAATETEGPATETEGAATETLPAGGCREALQQAGDSIKASDAGSGSVARQRVPPAPMTVSIKKRGFSFFVFCFGWTPPRRAVSGAQFTCVTGTEVQILTGSGARHRVPPAPMTVRIKNSGFLCVVN
jgi:hypothetical protein